MTDTRDKTLVEMLVEVRTLNIDKGWRTANGPGQNTLGDYIALLHTEIAEATEAYRDHRLADATGKVLHRDRDIDGPPKPEGVGAELADELIRLLDTIDVFQLPYLEPDLLLDDLEELDPNTLDPYLPPLRTFGDHMAWLARHADRLWTDRNCALYALRALVTVARHYGFDLATEYERKMAHNRTRPYRHGGRTIADGASA